WKCQGAELHCFHNKNTQSKEQSSITKSDDISLDSRLEELLLCNTDLSKYFICKKDPIEKIDEITELSKNNTKISSK
ncbi:26392_t:CDS:1, partial [Gigaspora margarita]